MTTKVLVKNRQIAGSSEISGKFQTLSPEKFTDINKRYRERTERAFKESDHASFRSNRKMGNILLG